MHHRLSKQSLITAVFSVCAVSLLLTLAFVVFQDTPPSDMVDDPNHDHSTHVHPEPITDEPTKKHILAHKDWDFVLNPGKPITVTTYSDTDCRFCKLQMERVEQLLEDPYYREYVSVAFRYGELPIYEMSPEEGLRLECVGRVSKDVETYYDYKRTLIEDYQSSKDFSPEALDTEALELVADETAYRVCLADPAVKEHLQFVLRQSHSIGVRQLPHNFFFTLDSDLVEYVGSMRLDFLKATLDSLIEQL